MGVLSSLLGRLETAGAKMDQSEPTKLRKENKTEKATHQNSQTTGKLDGGVVEQLSEETAPKWLHKLVPRVSVDIATLGLLLVAIHCVRKNGPK